MNKWLWSKTERKMSLRVGVVVDGGRRWWGWRKLCSTFNPVSFIKNKQKPRNPVQQTSVQALFLDGFVVSQSVSCTPPPNFPFRSRKRWFSELLPLTFIDLLWSDAPDRVWRARYDQIFFSNPLKISIPWGAHESQIPRKVRPLNRDFLGVGKNYPRTKLDLGACRGNAQGD